MSIHCYWLIAVLAFSRLAFCADGGDGTGKVCPLVQGFASGLAVVDEGLERAVALDMLTSDTSVRQTRGIVGEANTDGALLRYLNRSGEATWRSMTPRTGPQGLDHLFVKYNEAGTPLDLYIAESKWGTSRLGDTVDGPQMGGRWSRTRLEKIGRRYSEVLATHREIVCQKIPSGIEPNAEMTVMIRNRSGDLVERCFWRESSLGKWLYSGSAAELEQAQSAARKLGRLYENAANGRISLRRSVFHWDVVGEDLKLRIDTINRNDVINRGTVENNRLMTFKGAANKEISNELRRELVKRLKGTPEFQTWDSHELHRLVGNSYRDVVAQERFRVFRTGVKTTGNATVVAAGIDAALQAINGGRVDWTQVALTGCKTAVAVGTGEVAGRLVMKPSAGSRWIRGGAKASAVAVAFAAFDCYQACNGEISWSDAGANSAITGIGMGAVTATSVTLMSLPAMLGATASTGTAIGSLSGAAATSSTLAFYGGGSLAAGGLGAAGGTVVVGGIVAVAAIGVTAAATWGYGLYKEGQEWKQVNEWGNWLYGNLPSVQSLRL